MSHLNLLKQISLDNKSGYTIIFEDDFLIDSLNFLNDVNKILSKVDDFDLLFLGNVANNKGS
jgi:GR25 family glycosyltransferase involved in LPS biosynthesis